jgi:hypothetical protein
MKQRNFAVLATALIFIGGCSTKPIARDDEASEIQKRAERRARELNEIKSDHARWLCTVGVLEGCKSLVTKFALLNDDYKNGNYKTKEFICKNSKVIACSEEKSKTKIAPFDEVCKITRGESELECQRADNDTFYKWKVLRLVDLQNTATVVQAYVNQDKPLYDCRNDYYQRLDKNLDPGVDGRIIFNVSYNTETQKAVKKLTGDTVGDSQFHHCIETALNSFKFDDLDLKKKAEVNIIFSVKKFKDLADL